MIFQPYFETTYHHDEVYLTMIANDTGGGGSSGGAKARLPLVRLDGTVGSGALLRDVRLVVLGEMRLLPETLPAE